MFQKAHIEVMYLKVHPNFLESRKCFCINFSTLRIYRILNTHTHDFKHITAQACGVTLSRGIAHGRIATILEGVKSLETGRK